MDNTKPVNEEPIPGVDVSKLDSKKAKRFYRLIDYVLQSPCGKAHSLRTSLTSDTSCKRASFAADYVIAMLDDEASDSNIKKWYEGTYGVKVNEFKLDGVPFSGPGDAPVTLVEFYDYGCPGCKDFAPVLKEILSDFPSEVVLYYKQFPLSGHPNSGPAAQAALAAKKQDKFMEMHELLFRNAPRHTRTDLMGYARSLGLDMARFEQDYDAMATAVKEDMTEGDKAGVDGTPTIYINGMKYGGPPMHPRYIKMRIREELAVNR